MISVRLRCLSERRNRPSRRHGSAKAVGSQRLFSTERKGWRGTHESPQSDMPWPKDVTRSHVLPRVKAFAGGEHAFDPQ
jgi:hypothetical protein